MSPLPKSGNAIVFVPGLGSPFSNEPMDFLGKKLTLSLQRANTDKQARYRYEINEDLSYSPRQDEQMTAPSASIYKETEGNEKTHVADIFVYPYSDDITREYYDSRLFYQLWLIFLSLTSNLRTFLRRLNGAKSITRKDKLQVLIASGIFGLILLYAVIIGLAVWGTASMQTTTPTTATADNPAAAPSKPTPGAASPGLTANAPSNASGNQTAAGEKPGGATSPSSSLPSTPPPGQAAPAKPTAATPPAGQAANAPANNAGEPSPANPGKTGDATTPSQAGETKKPPAPAPGGTPFPWEKLPIYVILTTTIIPFVLKSRNMREVLHACAAQYCGSGDYFTNAEKRNLVLGRLSLLIKAVREATPKTADGKIVLVAYSLGSIVALDTLYPNDRMDSTDEAIDSLMTIGAPADFIRTFWPAYFNDRQPLANPDRKLPWTNVHCPQDIFASNFCDSDGAGAEVAKGIAFRGSNNTPLMPFNVLFPNDAATNDPEPDCLSALLLAGFRLHAIYWDKDRHGEYNVFDLLISRTGLH